MLAAAFLHAGWNHAHAQMAAPQLVILDTDIGDDIDDAFALGLALTSPELKILGVTTAWGDTRLRARLVDRLLDQTGRQDIPVAVGIETHRGDAAGFSQAGWARRQAERQHGDAVGFLLSAIKAHPGQITLIAIAPLTNVAAALEHDPQTFKQLRRIVMMGGSVRKGYTASSYDPDPKPDAEYNIAMDIPAAQKVFQSGVPLYMMPLDSTQVKLEEADRSYLFTQSTPITDALALLYEQWARGTKQQTPTLFDAVAVAYAAKPDLCPVTPVRIHVDQAGFTREEPGTPNAFVCLNSSSEAILDFYLHRLSAPPQGTGVSRP